MGDLKIKKAFSTASSARKATLEVRGQLGHTKASVTILFVSSKYDLDALGLAIKENFSDQNVIACTSSGEISEGGYLDFSISAVALCSPRLEVES